MGDAGGEEDTGEGGGALFDVSGGAEREESAAVDTSAGAEVDDAIGAEHELVVVLDNEERVALFAQGFEGGDEALVVLGVQADGGLVEDVKHAGEVRAELGGEADALGFAAGERAGGAVEGEVAEADVLEKFQALLDLRQDILRDGEPAGGEGKLAEFGENVGRWQGEEGGEREGGGAAAEREFDGAAGAVEASAAAFGAGDGVLLFDLVFEAGAQIGDFGRELVVVVGGLQHPVEDAAVAAAGGTPAAGRVV